jgi:hypothetical protein
MACSLCGVRGLDIPCSARIGTGSRTYENQRSKQPQLGSSSRSGSCGTCTLSLIDSDWLKLRSWRPCTIKTDDRVGIRRQPPHSSNWQAARRPPPRWSPARLLQLPGTPVGTMPVLFLQEGSLNEWEGSPFLLFLVIHCMNWGSPFLVTILMDAYNLDRWIAPQIMFSAIVAIHRCSIVI